MEVKDKRRFEESGDTKSTTVVEKMFDVIPLQKWVLIRKIEREETIAEGVIRPGGGRSSRGEVIAVGDEVPLNVGDVVVFTNFATDIEDIDELTGFKDVKLVR